MYYVRYRAEACYDTDRIVATMSHSNAGDRGLAHRGAREPTQVLKLRPGYIGAERRRLLELRPDISGRRYMLGVYA